MKRVTDPMRRIDLWLLLAATIAFVVLGGPRLIAKSLGMQRAFGLQLQREVRKQPLAAPMTVTSVQGLTIDTATNFFTLAGLVLPEDPAIARRASDLIRTATAQGIELIRTVPESGASLVRCEPRIFNWCRNCGPPAHYEQMSLNELILAFGYATLDEQAVGLTETEAIRLKAARDAGFENRRGMWSDRPLAEGRPFRTGKGLNISDAHDLRLDIRFRAEELAKAAASAAETGEQRQAFATDR